MRKRNTQFKDCLYPNRYLYNLFGGSISHGNTTHSKAGGIALIVHNSIITNIIQINRINGRIIIMGIQVETGHKVPNLSILNTYAPHMVITKMN